MGGPWVGWGASDSERMGTPQLPHPGTLGPWDPTPPTPCRCCPWSGALVAVRDVLRAMMPLNFLGPAGLPGASPTAVPPGPAPALRKVPGLLGVEGRAGQPGRLFSGRGWGGAEPQRFCGRSAVQLPPGPEGRDAQPGGLPWRRWPARGACPPKASLPPSEPGRWACVRLSLPPPHSAHRPRGREENWLGPCESGSPPERESAVLEGLSLVRASAARGRPRLRG